MASTYLSLVSFYGPTQVALAAPLAGVVVVVALTSTPRSLVVDTLIVAALTFATVFFQVSDWRLGIIGAVTSVVQGSAVLLFYRTIGRWPGAAARGIKTLSDVTPLAWATLLAAAASSLARWSGLGLVETSDIGNVVLTTVRTVTWAFVLGTLGLLVLAEGGVLRFRAATERGAGAAEIATGLIATATFLAATFPRPDPLPVIFPIFLLVVWASLRLHPLAAIGFSASVGVFAVACTVLDYGSFAAVSDVRIGAVLAQSFLLCLVVVATTLSLSVRDRDRTTAALQVSAQQMRQRARERDLVLENLAEGVVLTSPDGRILLKNDAWSTILDLSGQGSTASWPSAQDLGLRSMAGEPAGADYLGKLVSSSQPTPTEVTLTAQQSNGVARIVDVRIVRAPAPKPDSNNQHEDGDDLVVATFRDVTDQHERTAELKAFAGVVAHDLAGPLTSITGWAELLVEQSSHETSGKQLERFSRHILRAAEGMRSLLDDLLTLALARARELRVTEVDLSILCASWASFYSSTCDQEAAAKTGTPHPVLTIEQGMVVNGDETLLKQLFNNLLANAVKYVSSGVTPHVQISSEFEHETIVVRVEDNGIGIPAGECERVFDEFYRSTRGRDSYPGTGIGLAICKRVVERHEGRIRATAGSGGGTCIEIRLPDHESHATLAEGAARSLLDGDAR